MLLLNYSHCETAAAFQRVDRFGKKGAPGNCVDLLRLGRKQLRREIALIVCRSRVCWQACCRFYSCTNAKLFITTCLDKPAHRMQNPSRSFGTKLYPFYTEKDQEITYHSRCPYATSGAGAICGHRVV